MTTYNDIGIGGELDWPRIRKLMVIGLFAAAMVLAGDMLLGWGVGDASMPGLESMLARYVHLSDAGIFWSAFLGFIGIPLETLCYFSIYRLIAPKSRKYAHLYRTGLLGYIAFAGCGVHVPCLAAVYVYKYFSRVAPEMALDICVRYGLYFLLPGTAAMMIFYIIHSYAHIRAFAGGLTPYPKWCWIFSMPVGMLLVMLLKFAPESALRNALTAGWISIGNLWTFGGLLAMSRRVADK